MIIVNFGAGGGVKDCQLRAKKDQKIEKMSIDYWTG